MFNFNTILLFAVLVMLLLNLHKERKRDRKMAKYSAAIAAFIASQTAHNAKLDEDLNALNVKASASDALIQSLKDQIAAAVDGEIPAELQASLDALEANSKAVQDHADALVGTQQAAPEVPPADAPASDQPVG